jgi:signal transduction histidine kinase
MQIRIGLLLILLLSRIAIQAQTVGDSLKRELALNERSFSDFSHDTTRFRLLSKLTQYTKNWEKARNYWQQAIDLAEKRNWIAGQLEGYRGMGLHYRQKGAFSEAAYYFQQGLHLSEQANDLRFQILCYQSLGVAYSIANDTTKSLEAHRAAAKLAHNVDRGLYLSSINDIGNTYFKAKNYTKALPFYLQCLKENHPLDSVRQSWFLFNVAATYQELNQLVASQKSYNKLFTFGKYFTSEDSAEVYARLGQLYLKFGKIDLGLQYGLKANQIMPRARSNYSRSLVSQTLSEAYQNKEDWQQAFYYERQYHSWRDSILTQEQRQRLEGIKVGYESEKRKTQLVAEQRTNQFLWAGLALLGISGSILFFFNYLLRKRRKEIELQKDEIAKINNSLEHRINERTAELQRVNVELVRTNQEIKKALLKGQALERKRVASELHDNLGSTLTAIQWYMESLLMDNETESNPNKNYGDLYNMISRAYSEVRLLAHHMMPEVLEKEGLEIALHELAIPINKSKRLRLNVDTEQVSHDLTTQQKFELYSIALELCTNILKHAQASEAEILLNRTEKGIVMSVSDNGIGMTADLQKMNMGLKNIKSRLEAIGGHYSIRSIKGEGTMVLINLPFPGPQSESVEAMDREPVGN